MKICNMILTLSAKISPLSSEKIDKYEYLTGEKILLPNQRQVIEQKNKEKELKIKHVKK